MTPPDSILQRKLAPSKAKPPLSAEDGAKAWKVAFARAAREKIGLNLAVTQLTEGSAALSEVLDVLPDHALLAMIEGPGQSLGLVALSHDLTSAMIEVQTVGRPSEAAVPPRRPTRTDAAMCASVIEKALTLLEQRLEAAADLTWAGGYRYASFVEERGAVGLLLEDLSYRLLTAEVEVELGAKTAQLFLALPAAGAHPAPVTKKAEPEPDPVAAQDWQFALSQAVMSAELTFEAQIARIRLPLARANALAAGAILMLDGARVDEVRLTSSGGIDMPRAKLGQQRGMRAVKLLREEDGPPAGLESLFHGANPVEAAPPAPPVPQIAVEPP